MSDLLAPLGKEKRQVMNEFLESVKTSNLKTAFKKYLPAVLDEKNVSTKEETKTLTEGKVTEHTGDREVERKNHRKRCPNNSVEKSWLN